MYIIASYFGLQSLNQTVSATAAEEVGTDRGTIVVG